MNEQERRELEQLKSRQAELLGQLADLSHRLDAFERRMSAPASASEISESKREILSRVASPQPAAPPASAPAPAPAPVVESPKPPITVPPLIQPPPIPVVQRPAPAREIPPQPVAARVMAARVPVAAPKAQSFSETRAAEPPRMPGPQSESAKKGSLEMRLGTFWLVRIGIVMLLTSLVFFGAYAYQNFIPKLGAPGKVALLYLASGALLGVGTWLQRKQESLKNYAQVLQAGGLAAVYFTTYAAHHYPNLEIIRSALLDGALLLGWAGFIIWLADRKKSEVLALFAVLLAYYTSVITHAGLFTLYSNLVLTGAAVFFLVRNRWALVSFASLGATYASYAFWRFSPAGGWHWAYPGEGLWTGNCFLMGYWLIFSAAVFLTRHETFVRERRASFLSLNNAAFFSAFLLTMLEVHEGGFWKFSLIYGSVLIALAALARQLLAKDALAQNAYLTQGLLLVTLGFLTKLAGLKLGLVLAVESAILLSLGQLLKSRVMQAGSIITAALAAGWIVFTLQAFDRDGLLAAIAVGAMMLWNAFSLRKRTTYEQSVTHARTVIYTALALLVWTYAMWQNCNSDWRGLALACESVAFLLAARPLGNQVLRFGSIACACVVVGWEIFTLDQQFMTVVFSQRSGLLQGIITGALLVFSSIWEQRTSQRDPKQEFAPGVVFFSAIGTFIWLMLTATFVPREQLGPAFAIEAVLLTAVSYPLRLRELALYGQLVLLLSQALWLHDTVIDSMSHPWWNPVLIIACTLGLAAWCQRQKQLQLSRAYNMALQGLYALAIVGLLFYWLEPRFTAPEWLAFTSVLAIALTAYAALNRFWLLAAAGQIFLVVSAWQFAVQLWNSEQPAWYLPIVPIAALCLLSFSAVKWFETRPEAKPDVRDPILGIGLVYRVVALLMSLWWVHKYVPAHENVWVLVALGLVMFLVAGWRRKQELLWFAAAFTVTGLVKFWLPLNDTPTVYWPNCVAILVLLAQQQFAKRAPDRYRLSAEIHGGIIVVGGLSLWVLITRWSWILERESSGNYLTMAWSVL